MSHSEFADAAEGHRRRREDEQDARVRESIAAFGPLTARANGTDRTVTVEVGSGGRLRAVEITPAALTRGAAALRANILAASRKATARANHRTQQAFARAMGDAGLAAAEQLGLGYDPELLEDADDGQRWR